MKSDESFDFQIFLFEITGRHQTTTCLCHGYESDNLGRGGEGEEEEGEGAICLRERQEIEKDVVVVVVVVKGIVNLLPL